MELLQTRAAATAMGARISTTCWVGTPILGWDMELGGPPKSGAFVRCSLILSANCADIMDLRWRTQRMSVSTVVGLVEEGEAFDG
jgi:hypothetical protein